MGEQTADKTVENFQAQVDDLQKTVDAKIAENDAAIAKTKAETVELQKKLDASNAAKIEQSKTIANFEKLQGTAPRASGGAGTQESDEYCKNFMLSLRTGKFDKFISDEDGSKEYIRQANDYFASKEELKFDFAAQEAVTGIDTVGGLFVLPQIINRPITRVFETSPIPSIASVQNITATGQATVTIDDQEFPESVWAGEQDTYDQKNDVVSFGKLTVDMHLHYQYFSASMITSQDAPDVIQRNITKAGNRMVRDENKAFVLGTTIPNTVSTASNARPKGFMNISDYPERTLLDGYTRETLLTVVEPAANGITWQGLVGLTDSVPVEYISSPSDAKFVMNQRTWTTIKQLANANNDPQILNTIVDGTFLRELLGYQVIIAVDMPDIGTGTMPIAFGNFMEGYAIYPRLETLVQYDPYTTKGRTNYSLYRRVGGALRNYECISRYKTQAALSYSGNMLVNEALVADEKEVKANRKNNTKTDEVK